MFTTTQNVPSIYVEKSRDFQLLCNIIDVFVNSVTGNANKMQLQNSAQFCDERLLPLLATYVGFFTQEYLPAAVQRNIISVFPFIIKNKGNKQSIDVAATAALRVYPLINSIETTIINRINIGTEKDPVYKPVYKVVVTCNCQNWFDIDERYIREVMKYTLPTGYLLALVQKVGDETRTRYITL